MPVFSYLYSLVFKKVFLWGYPYSLTTVPTNLCNLNCPECPTGKKSAKIPKGKITSTNYKKIIDEVKKYIIYQMLYFQGEPFLHPELFNMIRYSEDHNIYTSISTNGHYLSSENSREIVKSGLKKIIISVDGASQESYEKYRVGGNLNSVLDGIKNLTIAKKELKSRFPKVIVQFLVFSHNEHEIPKINALCKKLKVDKLELKTAQISCSENNSLLPVNQKYSRYNNYKSGYSIKSKLPNKCLRLWSTLVITYEGLVIPCCFDKHNNYKMGNIIYADTLKIWSSDEFNNFRNSVLKNRKEIEICCNCTESLCI